MSELTKGQVQGAEIEELKTDFRAIQELQTVTLKRLMASNDEIEALKLKLKAAQAIAADLKQENADLRARLARLEAGRKQTIYPWKEDGTI